MEPVWRRIPFPFLDGPSVLQLYGEKTDRRRVCMNLVINCNFIIVLVLLCTLTVDHLWSTGGSVC